MQDSNSEPPQPQSRCQKINALDRSAMKAAWINCSGAKSFKNFPLLGRDSGNDFGRFSVLFLEGRILDIHAACNYPTRNTNFKSRISDILLKSIWFLVSHFFCRS